MPKYRNAEQYSTDLPDISVWEGEEEVSISLNEKGMIRVF